jgi:hypothetical protein
MDTLDPHRIARLTGVLFLVTFVTSIPALLLFGPVLDDAGYITGAGADGRIFAGATLELLLIVANIGTALVLYPLLRRQSETLALGYVAARIVECVFIAVGVLAVLAVVALRQESAADPAVLGAVGEALVAVKDATFLLGPGFVVGIGNGLVLGYLLYRSGLIPKRLALLGIVGGPLVSISGVLVMFGVLEFGGAGQLLFTIPEIIWEGAVLGVYLTVKGFRAPSASVAPALAPQPA